MPLLTPTEFRTSRYAQVEDQLDGGNLDDVIEQAEAYVLRWLDRQIEEQSYVEVHTPTGATIFLKQRDAVSLTSVKRRADHLVPWETLSPADFVLHKEAGYVVSRLGAVAGYEVEVTYVAGFDPVPADIKAAVTLQTVILANQDLEVYGVGDGKEPGIRYLQKDVHELISRYKRRGIG